MNLKNLCFSIVLLFALTLPFAGCGDDDKDEASEIPLSSIIYGGADAKGDYIAITIDGTAKTVTYTNYTTVEEHGPYTYSRVTDSSLNAGFSNMYITEVFEDASTYALFVIADGVAVIFQLFDNSATADLGDDNVKGTPGYAFYRKEIDNLDDFKGTAYNWVSFQMGTSEGNFEAGFAGIDSDTTGLFYGAAYNNRAESENWYLNGIKTINETGINIDGFSYDSANLAHTTGTSPNILTLIPDQNNDFILDFGENNGAGFAIRQAAIKEWQTAYNGTFFMMVYSNDDTGADQDISPMKLVLSNATTSGVGHYTAYDYEGTPVSEADLVALEDFTGGPGGTAVMTQFQTASGCSAATSAIVQEAYKVHGGFIADSDDGSVLFVMMDPSGNYLCFTMFMETGIDTYIYTFGFGLK